MRGASVPNYLMVGPGVNGFDPSLNVPYQFDPDGAGAGSISALGR